MATKNYLRCFQLYLFVKKEWLYHIQFPRRSVLCYVSKANSDFVDFAQVGFDEFFVGANLTFKMI